MQNVAETKYLFKIVTLRSLTFKKDTSLTVKSK